MLTLTEQRVLKVATFTALPPLLWCAWIFVRGAVVVGVESGVLILDAVLLAPQALGLYLLRTLVRRDRNGRFASWFGAFLAYGWTGYMLAPFFLVASDSPEEPPPTALWLSSLAVAAAGAVAVAFCPSPAWSPSHENEVALIGPR